MLPTESVAQLETIRGRSFRAKRHTCVAKLCVCSQVRGRKSGQPSDRRWTGGAPGGGGDVSEAGEEPSARPCPPHSTHLYDGDGYREPALFGLKNR